MKLQSVTSDGDPVTPQARRIPPIEAEDAAAPPADTGAAGVAGDTTATAATATTDAATPAEYLAQIPTARGH